MWPERAYRGGLANQHITETAILLLAYATTNCAVFRVAHIGKDSIAHSIHVRPDNLRF